MLQRRYGLIPIAEGDVIKLQRASHRRRQGHRMLWRSDLRLGVQNLCRAVRRTRSAHHLAIDFRQHSEA